MRIVALESITPKEVSQALSGGKVLVCPTDTVYGLVADATNRKAVRKVFSIKGRKAYNPLPVFVKDIATAKKLAYIPLAKEKYLKKAWPGKVTLVFKSRGVLPKETGTEKSIGLRIPKHALLRKILFETKRPLTGTSANLTGSPPFLQANQAVSTFKRRKHRPDVVLDAGKLPRSRPSRVVDVSGEKPKILRK